MLKSFRFIRMFFCLFCLTGLFSILAASLPAQNLIPALLDQGLKLYAAKDYSGASDYLGQVVDMAKDHDQARYYLVYSLLMIGNREKALEHAKILANRQPEQKQYVDLIAQIEKELTSEKANKGKKLSRPLVAKEIILGGYQSKDVVKEPRVSTQTYDITPPRPRTEIELAVEKIDEEDYDVARSMLGEILKKNPKEAKAHHYLGVINFSSGKYQEAIKDFDQAVKADPKNFQSFFLLGDCYRALDDFKKAEEQFKKALAIKEDIFAMLNIADIMVRQGRLKEAEELFDKISRKDANISDAKIGLAKIKLQKGFVEEAAEMINEVIVKGAGNPEAHYARALILMENMIFDDAAEEAKKAMEIVPGSLKYRSAYAMGLVKSYNVTRGLEEAAAIISEYPENIEARLVLAEGLIMSGASGDAAEHLAHIEKRNLHPMVSKLRYMAATRAGETEKAGTYLREYLERSAGQPKASLEYAQYLEKNQHNADALQAYYEISDVYKETAFAEQAKEGIERLEAIKRGAAEIERQEKSGLRPGKVRY